MPHTRSAKPDFICIGPTKTGTSWLYTVLRLHPEIWLPPVSEVNYYWGTGNRIPKTTFLQTLKQRIKGDIRIRWRKIYARERWAYYKEHAHRRKLHDIAWDLKYLFMPQRPAWYKSLYKTDLVAGDITGGYFTFDDLAIQQLAAHLPNTKILMNFRDPVSRLWSEAKMMLMFLPGKQFAEIPESAFIQRFDRAIQRLPSYYGLYQRWLRYFPAEQILVSYYDDLLLDPKAYLSRICRFLKVSETVNNEMRNVMLQRIFEGPRIELPDHYRTYLIKKTLPIVIELSEQTNDPQPREWIKKYTSIEGRK